MKKTLKLVFSLGKGYFILGVCIIIDSLYNFDTTINVYSTGQAKRYICVWGSLKGWDMRSGISYITAKQW